MEIINHPQNPPEPRGLGGVGIGEWGESREFNARERQCQFGLVKLNESANSGSCTRPSISLFPVANDYSILFSLPWL